MKITVRTSARIRIYPADAVLPTDGFLPSADASARTLGYVRADVRKNKNKNYFLFSTIFGFQSPKSPNSLSSAGFTGEAARRRRFFRPSSPSHPSKLYSSFGWLNSKVPKPFPPFSLRLIDVDGF
jgi:hypothetical protein